MNRYTQGFMEVEAESRPSSPTSEPAHVDPTIDCRIRFRHHHASRRPTETFGSYEESLRARPLMSTSQTAFDEEAFDLDLTPWDPFPTRPDFEFAEFVRKHRLPLPAIDDLLKKIAGSWASESKITIRSAKQLRDYIEASVPDVTKVSKVQCAWVHALIGLKVPRRNCSDELQRS